MTHNLGFRFFVIAVVIGFFAWNSYKGLFTEPGIELGIDLRGGSEIEGKFDFSKIDPRERQELLKQALAIIQQRIDGYGLKDVLIQPIGDSGFTVQISAKEKKNVDAIKELITVLGVLEFRITVEPDAANYDFYWKRFKKALAEGTPPLQKGAGGGYVFNIGVEDLAPDDKSNGRYEDGLRWYQLSDEGKRQFPSDRRPEGTGDWVLCRLDPYNVTGQSLVNANYRRDTQGIGSEWIVVFDVHKNHRNNMLGLTKDKGTHMAIVLNDRLDSAPVLQTSLSSSGRISGGFTEEKARALSAVLKAGALQQKPELIAVRGIPTEK